MLIFEYAVHTQFLVIFDGNDFLLDTEPFFSLNISTHSSLFVPTHAPSFRKPRSPHSPCSQNSAERHLHSCCSPALGGAPPGFVQEVERTQLMRSFGYGSPKGHRDDRLPVTLHSTPGTGTVSSIIYILTYIFPISLSNSTKSENQVGTVEFLLLGLSDDTDLQSFLFGLFLSMYLVTLLGNMLIILAISSDSHLHSPMYFFLSNLSFTDICFISTTVPKMLVNIQRQSKTISYTDCLSQVCFGVGFAGLENFLLAAMAYDRYVAICHPLRYSVIMNICLCVLLILLSLTISVVYALLQSLMLLRLSFCTDLEIPHFFCELV
ncbi:Olfactory receptor 7A17 [Sciurus carolinensis]|uniref:Olfactory receptor n=1 Tax=Sciurus carolinensis TaxID=30640 RepID=A0AA41N109_SCICA|nr:Olfactory receptor 7A17 [Sciurus carolinensis]